MSLSALLLTRAPTGGGKIAFIAQDDSYNTQLSISFETGISPSRAFSSPSSLLSHNQLLHPLPVNPATS
jgi:hypothetical protein